MDTGPVGSRIKGSPRRCRVISLQSLEVSPSQSPFLLYKGTLGSNVGIVSLWVGGRYSAFCLCVCEQNTHVCTRPHAHLCLQTDRQTDMLP